MKSGDTLWDLANAEYGDPTLYPIFLEVNKIDNPRKIPVGAQIIIPSPDEIKKISREHDPAKRKELIDNLGSGRTADNRPLVDSSSSTTGSSNSTGFSTPGPIKMSLKGILEQKVDPKKVKPVETKKH